MATSVVRSEEIELQDGTKLVVRPLNIKRLRRFMVVFATLSEPPTDKDGKELDLSASEREMHEFDIMLDAVRICIEGADAELSADKDRLEEVLDVPTMWKILEVAGGIKQDPNLMGTLTD